MRSPTTVRASSIRKISSGAVTMSWRIARSEREAISASLRWAANTSVRRPGPRPSPIGLRPTMSSDRQYLP